MTSEVRLVAFDKRTLIYFAWEPGQVMSIIDRLRRISARRAKGREHAFTLPDGSTLYITPMMAQKMKFCIQKQQRQHG